MKIQINKEKLVQSIKLYELNKYRRDFSLTLNESPTILLFKGKTNNKIAILSTATWPTVDIDKITELLNGITVEQNSLSDVLNFYTVAEVDSATETDIKDKFLNETGFDALIIDANQMRSISFFDDTFKETSLLKDDYSLVEKTLYDYLASSDDSSFLKNSILFSLILLCLFESENGLSLIALQNRLSAITGKTIDNIERMISQLRKNGFIEAPKAGSTNVMLTSAERDIITDSRKRSKAAEEQFEENFSALVKKFGITQKEELLDALRNIAVSECNAFTEEYHESRRILIERYRDSLAGFVSDKMQMDFLTDIQKILSNNTYLTTCSLGEKFLDLYRSDRYEEYINKNVNYIYLDTMVLMYYLCIKSSYNEEINVWDEPDFQRVLELENYCRSNRQKNKLFVTYDYLDEIVGELKKSIQLDWFSGLDLPVFETSNIFYNFYLHVCKCYSEENNGDLSYDDFLKNMGFTTTNPDSFYFKTDAIKTLKACLDVYDIEFIQKTPWFEQFEDIKKEYIDFLIENGKNKSENAINADIRTSCFLALKYDPKVKDNDVNYYFTTWDRTVQELRRATNAHLGIRRSYDIFSPSMLVQTISMKSFNLKKTLVGKEVYSFADDTFGFKAKVSSLFDNILNPYFASENNKNTELVKLLLNLEKKQEGRKEHIEISSRDSGKSFMEVFFVMIIDRLKKNDCGIMDLRDYLADTGNNTYIIGIFKKAFNTIDKKEHDSLAYEFVDSLKKYSIDKNNQAKADMPKNIESQN